MSHTIELDKGEKINYGIGDVSGLLMLGMTRRMKLPVGTEFILTGMGLVCLIMTIILEVRASFNSQESLNLVY